MTEHPRQVTLAYAVLARHVAAIDMAFRSGAIGPNIEKLIKAELEAAMQVIHLYEPTVVYVSPHQPPSNP